jgi:amidase
MDGIDFSGSATEAAKLLRHKAISSRELTAALLDRIEAVNPSINAVVEVRREQAMRDAHVADEATAGGTGIGSLHGVPMTIKDSFDVAGLHTTWGNPAFADYIAGQDATVVRRLREAGAIVIGKTNVHFMLSDYGQTANEIYGVTNNPWDPDRTPGGSTGGGAAAIAAGLSYLEYGSDLVGSIRIPASFCGVYGLKPTAEIVPLTGFQPPGPPAEASRFRYQSSVGPLGRSATDLRTALIATAGPEAPDSAAYSWRLAAPRRRRAADFRIGVVLDHQLAPVTSDVLAVLSDVIDSLRRTGATIVEGWPEGVDPAADYESFGFQVGLFFAFQDPEQEFAPFGVIAAQESRRQRSIAAWNSYFDDVDVFLCPATFTTAFQHDDRPFADRTIATVDGVRPYDDQPFWISHASLAGLPAVVAPVGITAAGLPVGLQIIGPRYEDDTAITFAELLADLIGGYRVPPGLTQT